jgi:hypothetical protein
MIERFLNILNPKLNAVDGDEFDTWDGYGYCYSPDMEWNSEDGGYREEC